MACINHPNLLSHDFWLCKNDDYGDDEKVWWGFVIHHGDCRTDYPNPRIAIPAYNAHPKLIARMINELRNRSKEVVRDE